MTQLCSVIVNGLKYQGSDMFLPNIGTKDNQLCTAPVNTDMT